MNEKKTYKTTRWEVFSKQVVTETNVFSDGCFISLSVCSFFTLFDFISSLIVSVFKKVLLTSAPHLCLPLTSILTLLISHLKVPLFHYLPANNTGDARSARLIFCLHSWGCRGLMHLQINVRVIGSAGWYLDCWGRTSWRSITSTWEFNPQFNFFCIFSNWFKFRMLLNFKLYLKINMLL